MRLPLPAMLLTVLMLGVLLPWMRGLAYMDAHLLLAMAQVPLAFTGALAFTFAARHDPLKAGLLAGTVTHLTALFLLSNGFITVNLLNWLGQVYLPPGHVLVALWASSFSLSLFSALAAAWMLAAGVAGSRVLLVSRLFFFAVIVAILLSDRLLNPVTASPRALAQMAVMASCVLIAASAVLVRAITRRR